MKKSILPIPAHLKNILIPKGDKNDEFFVAGDIACTCGNKEFSLSYLGAYENEIITLCEYEGVFYLAIECKCKECGKVHLIFDDNLHGWNGFVCGDESGFEGYEEFPMEKFKKLWKCPKCNDEHHEVSVAISSEGKEDFLENCEDTEFSEEGWVNAFSWITISTRCTNCGFIDKTWIDYETM